MLAVYPYIFGLGFFRGKADLGGQMRRRRSTPIRQCSHSQASHYHKIMSGRSAITNLKKDPDEKEESPATGAEENEASADRLYHYDPQRLQELRTSTPWTKDPKYFQKAALSPSATTKILMHCQSGVDKGIGKGGTPIEVMGLLFGRPDPNTPHTLVITDAFPLPIEGFETRVIADDVQVTNHMIQLGEALEQTRLERFMGWYHSHPFDLSDHSHCFLSQTDLSTQLQWQRAEDPHGNPFVAIVVDPLRSAHLKEPVLKAFRAYPPEYKSPVANECPDMSVEPSKQIRLEHWGSCWNRYYELQVEYFMSTTSRGVMQQLTSDYLWMRGLQAQPRDTVVGKLKDAAKALQTTATAAPVPASAGSSSNSKAPNASKALLMQAVQAVADVASEQVGENALQKTSENLFS